MTKAENIIKQYMKDKTLTNAEIAKKVNATRRYVRYILNPIRENTYRVPKILLLDIETSPMEVYVWGLYKQRISHENIIKEWSILSWSAKWLFDPEIQSDVVTTKDAINRKDKKIIKSIWELMEKADILIAHNLNRFDLRRLNARFILNGINPPSPYRTIDTLKVAQRMFAFASHKLDYLTKLLNLTKKKETTYELWKRCVSGDKTALRQMVEYNKQDVIALEDLYVVLRPWIRSHPNIALYMETDEPVCPNCGNINITKCGDYCTTVGRFTAFRCKCGAICRSRKSNITKTEKMLLKVPVAR